MTIGKRIADLRWEKGLTQSALGELLGVSNQAVSKWGEDGVRVRRIKAHAAEAVVDGPADGIVWFHRRISPFQSGFAGAWWPARDDG